jgi:hypothetical protein
MGNLTNQLEFEQVEDPNEILRRQVAKGWTKADGSPMSVAFSPTPKDQRKLSTDRQRATPEQSFKRYASSCGDEPSGTWGVSIRAVSEAHAAVAPAHRDSSKLFVLDDAAHDGNHEDHASILFPEIDVSKNQLKKVHERLATELKKFAIEHGKLYPES